MAENGDHKRSREFQLHKLGDGAYRIELLSGNVEFSSKVREDLIDHAATKDEKAYIEEHLEAAETSHEEK